MAVPQLVLDAIRFLLALATPASLVALVLAGIALRREGTRCVSVGGGGFSKWMFWAIVMITLPQVFGWFAFWGVGAPLPGGGIGNGWMSGFANDAVIFVNTFVIGRLVPVLAAWMVLRSGIDWTRGYSPLAWLPCAVFLSARAHIRAVGRLSLPDGLGRRARHGEIRGPGRMEQPRFGLDHAAGNGELDVQRLFARVRGTATLARSHVVRRYRSSHLRRWCMDAPFQRRSTVPGIVRLAAVGGMVHRARAGRH